MSKAGLRRLFPRKRLRRGECSPISRRPDADPLRQALLRLAEEALRIRMQFLVFFSLRFLWTEAISKPARVVVPGWWGSVRVL